MREGSLSELRSALAWAGRAYYQHRYATLFYSLLFTLVAAPLLSYLLHRDWLLELLLAVNLFVGAFGFRRGRYALLLVMVVAVCLRLTTDSLGTLAFSTHALALWTAVAFITGIDALRYALRGKRIDSEHVYAALSAYLLAGFFFGVVYLILETLVPGSLVGHIHATGRRMTLETSVYFSLVTLATLGYGDILPGTGIAQGLAVLEAISGQLYIAVMIARLVGSYVQRDHS